MSIVAMEEPLKQIHIWTIFQEIDFIEEPNIIYI